MISKKEVKHIAKLARLGLTEKEIEKYQKELSSILDYIKRLERVDSEISNLPSISHPSEFENIIRSDKESEKCKGQGAKLLDLAPQTEKGYLKVRSVLNPVRSPGQKKLS